MRLTHGQTLIPLLAAMIATSACMAEPASVAVTAPPPPATAITYPAIDPTLGEAYYPNEKATATAIAAEIDRSIRLQYAVGGAKRDAHPKAHGCVKAQFEVLPNLPAKLSKGVFIPGKTYAAWIRFSNGDRDATRPDAKGDARGMAIKLLGVPGTKLLDDDPNAQTQDFIMINHPVFFNNDPARYLKLIQRSTGGILDKALIPFALGFKGSVIAAETVASKISNPLQTRYFSMVPYQLGLGADKTAVKYSARNCAATVNAMPNNPEHNFLRAALKKTLNSGEACMQFLVQPRTLSGQSVEDSMTEWDETLAPFYPVATIHIPAQNFDTPEQNQMCENLSFTPWHALPDHKPLGVTNRIRKIVYDRISRTRHEINAAPRVEPTQ
jgi:hypothetical protein